MAEEDWKKIESWKVYAEGINVLTGLFSAAVVSLTSMSIQDIQQNPQDTSNFYLANIYQALVDPKRSSISSLSVLLHSRFLRLAMRFGRMGFGS
ncbi:hypothetical protein EI94DRAFT_1805193 [Lactarius quietus]|nr:hypothetical protein EI94DRAFT_1805193 [Lactarius quietus]